MSERDNRRQFPRHPCDMAMEGRSVEPRGTFACRALNASEGGLLLESETPLAVGQRLTLSLRGSDRSRAIDAEVEVVWVAAERGVHRAGVRFLRQREEFVV